MQNEASGVDRRVQGRRRTDGREGRRRGPGISPSKADFFWLSVYLVLLIACAAMMALTPDLRGYAFVGLIVTAALMPVGLRSQPVDSSASEAQTDQINQLCRAIDDMRQEAGLSDAAKRVLHRRAEREILTREIERDIDDEDWDAAMVLVKELAERFGYRQEAEHFRGRIEVVRAETLDRNVSSSLSSLESLIAEHRWTDAFAEAGRIARLYPESHRVDGLRAQIEDAKRRYKLELERRFLHQAERDEVDSAMATLKELDSYLTEEEAEPFREVARGVIGKARDNLGVQFKLLIQDRSWVEALEVGTRIIEQFPNTRMAQEVRDMLDMLRARAAEIAGASKTGVN